MKIKKEYLALLVIFLAVFLFRTWIAFQTPTFTAESYFNARQIINIRFFDSPIFNDSLSYGGRQFFFLPLFHYLMAGFSLLIPLQTMLKILPNFFATLVVIIVYFISLELTKEKVPSLLAALSSGIVPIFFFETVNSISVFSLFIPLFFFLIYCIMKIEKRIYVWLFVTGLLVLVFLDSLSLLLITGLLFYIALIKLEQIKYDPAEAELILFGTLLATWMTFVMFNTPLLVHGPSLIWQNIPESVLSHYHSSFSPLRDIFMIGVLPFLSGLFIIYKYVLREHQKDIYLFTGFAFAILLLIWLELINVNIGLVFLGIIFSILFAQFVKISLAYLANTRLSQYRNSYVAFLFIIIILTSGFYSFAAGEDSLKETPSEHEIKALLWLRTYSSSDSVVAATLREGHLISGIAQRKNIADTNFLLVADAAQRVKDIDTLYSTPYEIEAIRILNKYDADYIFLSKRTVDTYKGEALQYSSDKNCFEQVYDNPDVLIYRSLCKV